MAMGASNGSQFMSEINVTPFVDVMLVLLIIFMVAAPMMTQGVDVSLPQASAKSLNTSDESLTITINKDGDIHINTYKVALEALKTKLEIILDGRADRQVFLRADKDVAYGLVVRVMSEIKGAGVEKLGMVTEPLNESIEKSQVSGKKKKANG
jgi:biopolymer transport protein TolR